MSFCNGRILLILLLLFLPLLANSEIESKTAVPKTGTIRLRYNSEPFSLNPIVKEGFESVEIQFYVIEGLLAPSDETNEWIPWLADSWKVAPDKKTFEFHIRENAFWSDGKPVTSEDVKFSYEVIYDDHFPTAHMRPYYDGIKRVTILDKKRVRFETKEPYFGNFTSSAGIPVVPKHIYGDPIKGPKLHKSIVGSGPYILETWNEGRNIILKRNPRWWGLTDSYYKKRFNPERVVFQFVGDDNVALEMIKKGDLDFMWLTADQFLSLSKDTHHNIDLVRTQNLRPRSVTSIGFNLERKLFSDRNVRLALAHLVDRRTIARTFFYNFIDLATGPWYRQSEFTPKEISEIQFSPDKAFEILKKNGWSDTDNDKVLDKIIDGKKTDFRFDVITNGKAPERILTIFKEDAKQIGVDVQIKQLTTTAFSAAIDKGDFDAANLTGGAWLVNFDAKPWLHSKSLPPGGLNFSRYKNAKVDSLLEKDHRMLSFKQRMNYMREIFKQVAFDLPQIPLFNDRDLFYAVSKRVGRPADTLPYDVATKTWWIKENVK